MIKQPEEMTFDNKRFSMILYGSPGVGKTTLALSAPNPILIDFDRGISRVKAYHRKATIVCNTYEEVLEDIKSPEIRDCETIVIDTGGSFVTYLQDWAMRTDPKTNCNKDGTISLKGYGNVKREFNRFTNMVRDTMNKNIIYVFHSEEKADRQGNTQQRLICEGATKNTVWQPCDFGGYVQMVGNQRVISFTPTEEYFAKGCYGIEGSFQVPALKQTDSNNFLTQLFDMAKKNIASENEAFAPVKEEYELTMTKVREIIAGINSIESANQAAVDIPALPHALTSKKEASAMLQAKTKELGYVWDKTEKTYKVG